MKNASFLAGLSWLILGAGSAPDWDVGISVLMAGLTYLTADRALRWLLDWRTALLGLLCAWASIDGVYWLYWSLVRPEVLDLMRWANFEASAALYVSCGVIWNMQFILRKGRTWQAQKA